MNSKRAQSMGIAIIGLIVFFIIGLMCINFLFNEVDTARTGLNCANATAISDGTKLTCLVTDLAISYWIWIIVAVALGFVLVRINL